MSASAAVLAILAALWLGAMIPGPSFVLVARNAIGQSRGDGLATALGMGAGGLVFGGVYLIYVASKIWRDAGRPVTVHDAHSGLVRSGRKSFLMGLTTQLSNPKTAIWYGSIFAALLPQHPPLWCYIVLPPMVFAVECGWYTIVALCFSSEGPRGLYLRAKTWIDRIAAGAISLLGLRLILNASKPTL